MNTKIELRNLYKLYSSRGSYINGQLNDMAKNIEEADTIAVKDLNLSINEGDRIGIIGRNGAGKSTLLQIIAGLVAPSAGSVEVNGKVTSIMTLGIGLRDDLSGRENIYIDGEIQGRQRKDIEKIIDGIISFAELGEFIDYPVRTYSTGMKARLAFSMISHIDPEILIIDEALSVGDALFSAKATAKIREICNRGKIVIIVSHSMQAIKDICNRCLWMEDGRIVMDGAPEIVTNSYIDSVRADDELILITKFNKLVGSYSNRPGYLIKSVDVFNGTNDSPRVLLESGLPTWFSIRAATSDDYLNVYMRVQIHRLDDLLFFDEKIAIRDFQQAKGLYGFEIKMEQLVLSPNIYKLSVILGLDEVVLAGNISIFEVFSKNIPRGGKPMLLYPAKLDIAPINKE